MKKLFSRTFAARNLRTNVEDIVARGEPTDAEIDAELRRLNALTARERKEMREREHQFSPGQSMADLEERIEQLEDRVDALRAAQNAGGGGRDRP